MATKRPASPSGEDTQATINVNNAKKAVPSRLRKKQRKKARQHHQDLLGAAILVTYTGSVVVDRGKEEVNSLQVTTTTVLPRRAQLQKMRMLTTNKPACIYTQPLLILDLNGILCHRVRQRNSGLPCTYRPSIGTIIANTAIIPRPVLTAFLTYLDSNFCLAIWTSAQPTTAKKIMDALIPPHISKRLLFVWGQNKCKVVAKSGAEEKDILFVKELDKVWSHYPIYNAGNTWILDDSPEKCPFPRNALHPKPMDGLMMKNSSDLVNHTRQFDFLEKLAQFWGNHPVSTTWDELGEKQPSQDGADQNAIWEFLEENATGHMGWRNESKKVVRQSEGKKRDFKSRWRES